MTESKALDLIHLEDMDGNRCLVRVTGRLRPGVLTSHDLLRADVLISASFVDARLEMCLSQQDLSSWQQSLAELGPGGNASLGAGRGLELGIQVNDERSVSVWVEDPDRLTTVLLIRTSEDWIAEHHDRLRHVRQAWPGEVVETASAAYEWGPEHRH
ncbi:DUF5959 family protein [Streptomyces smyrnaeus]|uniref:DUF5959 family protein n=1 Tax=Streptomyces TaxID=1883 RepID=UPI000C175261|nr:DUF5959 family protein [Streptomyces sp. B15]MBQ1123987.1 hypothetical protein [Streptomyces sp. B15]MBQ1157951.1 hypothetical protein [Streptomyces sp. A73]